MSIQAHIHTLIKAIAYKFSIESDAQYKVLGTVTGITYAEALFHPWPREFPYQTEFFTHSAEASQVATDIRDMLGSDVEHVLSVFQPEAKSLHTEFQAAGYQLAWSNVLMGRSLTHYEPIAPVGRVTIRSLASEDDVARANAMEPDHFAHAAAISDLNLHDFVAEQGGRVVGKAQLVTVDPDIAYVSDMFVAPDQRQQGIGRDLMRQLHLCALDQGAKDVILIPSRMTREIRFYAGFGYRDLIPMHLYIPYSH